MLARVAQRDVMGLAVGYVFLVVGIAVVCALLEVRGGDRVGVGTEICLAKRGGEGARLLMSGGRSPPDTGLRASSRDNGLETS